MSWQRVRGHDAVVARFENAVRLGRLGHAYLLVGPAGVGKRLFATTLAQAFLCEASPPRLEPCENCVACQLFRAGNHPDFIVACRPPESLEIPIDVVRELCLAFVLKPARGRRRVAILDDGDDLNQESANCFLKTLEEPPPNSVLLLIGTSTDRQLPTIRSRCQLIRFSPLPPSDVDETLAAHGIADPSFRQRLVRQSEGSIGRALALADPALFEFQERFISGLLRTPPNSVELARDWARFLADAGKEGPVQRLRASLTLGLLIDFLSRTLRRGGNGEASDTESLAMQFAARVSPELIIQILDHALEADLQIERRAQLVLVIEAFLDAVYQVLQEGNAGAFR